MPRIGDEAVTGAHIPFHSHRPTGQLADLHMDPRTIGLKRRPWMEMGDPMLSLDRVVGLAAVDPVAIDADAHAA